MPALKPTDFSATITWLGTVPDGDTLPSAKAPTLTLGFDGPAAEKHAGLTRLSCSRVVSQHPRGTEIANVRQLSVMSEEEIDEIANTMGLAELNPEWLGATMVIKGIPDFTLVPPSARLQGPDGCQIVIDMENRPCHLPGRVIETVHPGFGKAFKTAANRRRGVTAWVERPGTLTVGDALRLHIPDQPVWPHL